MPFNLKKLFERRVELMGQLENLVKTCETETRAFNEDEQTNYSEILTEIRSSMPLWTLPTRAPLCSR